MSFRRGQWTVSIVSMFVVGQACHRAQPELIQSPGNARPAETAETAEPPTRDALHEAREAWNNANFVEAKRIAQSAVVRADAAGDGHVMSQATDFLALYHRFLYSGRHDPEADEAAALRFASLNLGVQKRVHGERHAATARAHAFLAMALLPVAKEGDEEYVAHAREAVTIAREHPDDANAAFATVVAAQLLIGRSSKMAQDEMIRAAELITRKRSVDPFERGWTYHMVGHFSWFSSPEVKLINAKKADAAVSYALVPHHPFRLHMQMVIAANTDPGRGVRILEQATRLSAEKYGEGHEQTLDILSSLAAAYERDHRPAEAIATYRRVLDRERSTLGSTHPSLRWTLHSLGELHEKRGELQEALGWFEQEARISTHEATPGCHDELRPFKSMFAIANRLGDLKAAGAYADRGIRTCEERGIRDRFQATAVEGVHFEAAQVFLKAGVIEQAWCHLRSAELRRTQGAKFRKEPDKLDAQRIAQYQTQLTELSERGGFTPSEKRCKSLMAFAQDTSTTLGPASTPSR